MAIYDTGLHVPGGAGLKRAARSAAALCAGTPPAMPHGTAARYDGPAGPQRGDGLAPSLDSAVPAFYSGLAHAAAHGEAVDATAAAAHLHGLQQYRHTLATLAQRWPTSFAAMDYLLAAEIARLQDQPMQAMRGYEQALAAAAPQQQRHVQALAHELAGNLAAQLGWHTAAGAHRQQAQLAQQRWGVHGAAHQLETRVPGAGPGAAPHPPGAVYRPSVLPGATAPAAAEAAPVARISAMGQFAASIAHEVNQPLAAMVLNAGAALNWLKHEPPDLVQVRDSLRTIITAGTRAADIIGSMRRLAQRTAPELAPVRVDETIAEVLAQLRSELQQHGIRVAPQLQLGSHSIRADRGQLQQVMMNLFINAIDAMAGVRGRDRVLSVTSQLEGGGTTLRISVEDSGVGLTPQQLPRIFDALVSSKPAGMGMGLAICRAIIDAHGGSICCHARAPHGAAFHISLPALATR